MSNQILVGTDPEVFVVDSTGTIIPSIGLIGGSKDEPRDIGIGSLQEDNVLAEFNIKPAESREVFITSVMNVMGALEKTLYPNTINIKPSHVFEMNVLHQYGPVAFQFGCDPDFNAYTGAPNIAPNPMMVGGLRSAGGHIHVGLPLSSEREVLMMAMTMDLFLGVPSVLLDSDMDRRRLYGKAGAFRFKPYGLEYRTLSNFWLKNKELIGWAYDNTIISANRYKELPELLRTAGITVEMVEDIINHADTRTAKRVVELLGIPMPEVSNG